MIKLCTLNQLNFDQLGNAKTGKTSLMTDDHKYIVIQQNSAIFVYRNSCPHLNKRLTKQSFSVLNSDKNFIRCQRHDALFTMDQGLCIKGPCSGKYLQKVDFSITDNHVCI